MSGVIGANNFTREFHDIHNEHDYYITYITVKNLTDIKSVLNKEKHLIFDILLLSLLMYICILSSAYAKRITH